jgi:hypothetical protein
MSAERQYPKTIIVATRDIMREFERNTRGLPLRPSDFTEIATQVLDLLLNFGPDACGSYMALPDTSRLVQTDWPDAEQFVRLKNASFQMAWAIHRQCEALGFRTYQDTDGNVKRDFPYAMSGWHNGSDAVLDHMPY